MGNDWEIPPYPTTSENNSANASSPPPPYEEGEAGVSCAAVVPDLLIKSVDSCTLTEPSDYALAYKAMQRNEALPIGKINS